MSVERAQAMLKAWWGGRSNLADDETEAFEHQYDLAVSGDVRAFLPSLQAFDRIGGWPAWREYLQRLKDKT
jgi:hypothetical protein